MPPVSSVSCGVPDTVTDSLKVTWMDIASPTLKVPFAVDDVTDDTVGTVVSTTSALLAPREFDAPGLASVNVAALPAASWIVPEFSANAEVLA